MGFLEDLNKAIDKYFIGLLNSNDFILYEENAKGMGALRKYENQKIKIQIINDRGLINLDVSSKHGKEDFRDTEILYSMIELGLGSNMKIGKWQREKILNKRLDLENQANFIKENWSVLIRLFDCENYKQTIKNINKIGLERSKLMFG